MYAQIVHERNVVVNSYSIATRNGNGEIGIERYTTNLPCVARANREDTSLSVRNKSDSSRRQSTRESDNCVCVSDISNN